MNMEGQDTMHDMSEQPVHCVSVTEKDCHEKVENVSAPLHSTSGGKCNVSIFEKLAENTVQPLDKNEPQNIVSPCADQCKLNSGDQFKSSRQNNDLSFVNQSKTPLIEYVDSSADIEMSTPVENVYNKLLSKDRLNIMESDHSLVDCGDQNVHVAMENPSESIDQSNLSNTSDPIGQSNQLCTSVDNVDMQKVNADKIDTDSIISEPNEQSIQSGDIDCEMELQNVQGSKCNISNAPSASCKMFDHEQVSTASPFDLAFTKITTTTTDTINAISDSKKDSCESSEIMHEISTKNANNSSSNVTRNTSNENEILMNPEANNLLFNETDNSKISAEKSDLISSIEQDEIVKLSDDQNLQYESPNAPPSQSEPNHESATTTTDAINGMSDSQKDSCESPEIMPEICSKNADHSSNLARNTSNENEISLNPEANILLFNKSDNSKISTEKSDSISSIEQNEIVELSDDQNLQYENPNPPASQCEPNHESEELHSISDKSISNIQLAHAINKVDTNAKDIEKDPSLESANFSIVHVNDTAMQKIHFSVTNEGEDEFKLSDSEVEMQVSNQEKCNDINEHEQTQNTCDSLPFGEQSLDESNNASSELVHSDYEKMSQDPMADIDDLDESFVESETSEMNTTQPSDSDPNEGGELGEICMRIGGVETIMNVEKILPSHPKCSDDESDEIDVDDCESSEEEEMHVNPTEESPPNKDVSDCDLPIKSNGNHPLNEKEVSNDDDINEFLQVFNDTPIRGQMTDLVQKRLCKDTPNSNNSDEIMTSKNDCEINHQIMNKDDSKIENIPTIIDSRIDQENKEVDAVGNKMTADNNESFNAKKNSLNRMMDSGNKVFKTSVETGVVSDVINANRDDTSYSENKEKVVTETKGDKDNINTEESEHYIPEKENDIQNEESFDSRLDVSNDSRILEKVHNRIEKTSGEVSNDNEINPQKKQASNISVSSNEIDKLNSSIREEMLITLPSSPKEKGENILQASRHCESNVDTINDEHKKRDTVVDDDMVLESVEDIDGDFAEENEMHISFDLDADQNIESSTSKEKDGMQLGNEVRSITSDGCDGHKSQNDKVSEKYKLSESQTCKAKANYPQSVTLPKQWNIEQILGSSKKETSHMTNTGSDKLKHSGAKTSLPSITNQHDIEKENYSSVKIPDKSIYSTETSIKKVPTSNEPLSLPKSHEGPRVKEHPLKSIVEGHEMLTKLLSTVIDIPEKLPEMVSEKLPEMEIKSKQGNKLKDILNVAKEPHVPDKSSNIDDDINPLGIKIDQVTSQRENINILGDFTIDIEDLDIESELKAEIYGIELKVDRDRADESKLKSKKSVVKSDDMELECEEPEDENQTCFDLSDPVDLDKDLLAYRFDVDDPASCFDLTNQNSNAIQIPISLEPEYIDLDDINTKKDEIEIRRKSIDTKAPESKYGTEAPIEAKTNDNKPTPKPIEKTIEVPDKKKRSKSPKPPKSPKSPKSQRQPSSSPLIPPYNPVIPRMPMSPPRMPMSPPGSHYIESSVARFYTSVKRELYPSTSEAAFNPYMQNRHAAPQQGIYYPEVDVGYHERGMHMMNRPPQRHENPAMYDASYQHSQMLQFMAHRNIRPGIPPVPPHSYGERYQPPWPHPYNMRFPPPLDARPSHNLPEYGQIRPPVSLSSTRPRMRPPSVSSGTNSPLPPPPPLQRRPDLPTLNQIHQPQHLQHLQETAIKPKLELISPDSKDRELGEVRDEDFPTISDKLDGKKGYTCETCGKSFSKFQILRFHCRTHALEAEEKGVPFEHPVEPKSNSENSVQNVTNIKPATAETIGVIKCKFCGIALINRQTLRKHIIRKHKHVSPEEVYEIISDPKLITHQEPLYCKVCNLKLATPKTLKNHMKLKHPESLHLLNKPPVNVFNRNENNSSMASSKQKLVPYLSAEEQLITSKSFNKKHSSETMIMAEMKELESLTSKEPKLPPLKLSLHPTLPKLKVKIKKRRPARKCKFCKRILVNFQVLKKHARRKHKRELGLIQNPHLELTPEMIVCSDAQSPKHDSEDDIDDVPLQNETSNDEIEDVKPVIHSETSLSAVSSALSDTITSLSGTSSPALDDTNSAIKTDFPAEKSCFPILEQANEADVKSAVAMSSKLQSQNTFYCDVCSVPFCNSKTLRYHRNRKHPEIVNQENNLPVGTSVYVPASQRPIKCNYCYRVLVNRQIMKKHLLRKHPDVAQKAISEMMSEASKPLPLPAQPQSSGPVDCKVCGKRLSNAQVLRKHLRRLHAADLGIRALPPSKNPVECKLCGLILGYKGNLKKHIVRKHPTAIDANDDEALNALAESMAAYPIPRHKLIEFQQKEDEQEILKQNAKQVQVAKKSTSKPPVKSWHTPLAHKPQEMVEKHTMQENKETNNQHDSDGIKMVSATETFLALKASRMELNEDNTENNDVSSDDDEIFESRSVDENDQKLQMRPHIILTNVMPLYRKMVDGKKTFEELDNVESDLDMEELQGLEIPDMDFMDKLIEEEFQDHNSTNGSSRESILKPEIDSNCGSKSNIFENAVFTQIKKPLAPHLVQKKRIKMYLNSKKSSFTCSICQKSFSTKPQFDVHVKQHDGIKPHCCSECGQNFSLKSSLAKHLIEVHKYRTPYQCKTCGKYFVHKRWIKIHSLIHAGILPHKCKVCTKAFPLRSHLKKHTEVHNKEKPYACVYCSKTFKKKSHCAEHQLLHKNKRPHACSTCGKRFPYSSYLRVHNQLAHSEAKPYECNICHKKFSISQSLKTHMLVHTKVKNYKCNLCNKYFAYHGALQYHTRSVHTHEKPYSCSVCKKNFVTQQYLKIHMRLHTGEKPYACKLCPKTFSQISHLKTHMDYHLGNKPFKCNECGKRFTQSSHLRSHEKVHTGEKNYVCQICNKEFTHGSSLKSHMRQHTGERPYQCALCPSAFTQIHALKLHQATSGHITPGLAQLKPMPCTMCNKVYYFTAALKKHMVQSHSATRQFECICGKSFFAKESLNNHKCPYQRPKPSIEAEHQCDQCGRKFTHISTLTRHVNTFHASNRQDPVFKCPKCDQVYGTKRTMTIHLQSEHKPDDEYKPTLTMKPKPMVLHNLYGEPIKCKYCPLMLANEKTLKIHVMRKHPEGFQFLPPSLKRRMKKSKPNTRCEFCKKKFSTYANMKRHINQQHWDEKDEWEAG